MRLVLALGALALVAGCAQKPAEPQNFVVYFETGEATVTPVAQQVLATAAAASHEHTPSKIVVEGHADGGTTNDAALADKRALAVIHVLTDDGIDANRIEKAQGTPPAGETGVAAHQVIIRFVP
jgi:outer membrane protein OmpA-like peptidoglycan-associated protein